MCRIINDENANGIAYVESSRSASGLHRGPVMEGFHLPDDVMNHIYCWNAARLIPKVKQVLEARHFTIGCSPGRFKSDRLPPDVTITPLTIINNQRAHHRQMALGFLRPFNGTTGSYGLSVWLPPYRVEISEAAHAGSNGLEVRVASLRAHRLNGDSLPPESRHFTRSNLDRIHTDPTSDSSYGRVPEGPTRPVYAMLPPLMKSGLLGPVHIITTKDESSA